ncbi:hypothetical protein FA13DRAFT_1735609 [Coprinellus micaceus]|uniref:Uncharacterized protein n=1 Tax=Coprinellus micaceus TaxID=71717 RepID=A0A4Y7T2T0_COPMI|nr:hypothetical protein FA13DRAFT_1735609 [Coprinellus micaceus]
MTNVPVPLPSSYPITPPDVPLEIWGEIFLDVLSTSPLKVTTQVPTLCRVLEDNAHVDSISTRNTPISNVHFIPTYLHYLHYLP